MEEHAARALEIPGRGFTCVRFCPGYLTPVSHSHSSRAGVVSGPFGHCRFQLILSYLLSLQNWSWLFPQEARKPGDDHWAPHHQGPGKCAVILTHSSLRAPQMPLAGIPTRLFLAPGLCPKLCPSQEHTLVSSTPICRFHSWFLTCNRLPEVEVFIKNTNY